MPMADAASKANRFISKPFHIETARETIPRGSRAGKRKAGAASELTTIVWSAKAKGRALLRGPACGWTDR
jgi:hypothetical protein